MPAKKTPAARSLQDIDMVRSSSLIFTGTVVERGASTVPDVPASDNLVVVRVERVLRVAPVLGDLRGKLVTVAATAPESLTPGQEALFFTNSWVHGRGIAVREVAHRDVEEEDNVAGTVAQLPELHLQERLENAELVVEAEVVRVGPVERTSFERNAALWATAELKVGKVLRGKRLKSTVVYFPTSDHPMWAHAPRFTEGQRGIFILRPPDPNANPSEKSLGAGALIALDPADFQPESQRAQIEKLLGAVE